MARRRVLLAVALVLAGAAVVFGGGTTEPSAAVAAAKTDAKEAPDLAARVAAGQLPPLAQRLPQDPLVVKPNEKAGKYGGTMRIPILGNTFGFATRYMGYENLVRWAPDWSGVVPNLASRWEIGDGGRSFTFYLRKGIKWSDGSPFTAEDFRFYYEDVLMNADITPARAGTLVQGKDVAKFTKIDDYTLRYTFTNPNGFFLQQLCFYTNMLYEPKNYLQKFHIKYNPNAGELAKQAKFATWAELFKDRMQTGSASNPTVNPEKPNVAAWMYTVAPGAGSLDRAEAVRNPYYWKVDTDGRQLPYIDRVEFFLFQDAQTVTLRVMSGAIDFVDQWIVTTVNKPVFADNAQRGGYRFVTTTPTAPNELVIQFNYDHEDQAKRALFRNKDFRIAMSYALNRKEIIDVVFAGQTPAQVAPRPESELYSEKLAKQYLEFDLAKASQHFARAGLTTKDAQGFLLMPNGKRLTIVFEIDDARTKFIDAMEVMMRQWKAAGVDVQMKTLGRTLWEQRVRQGSASDATIHQFGGGVGSEVYTDPRYYMPFSGNSIFARAWSTWRTNPQGANATTPPEEPPAAAKKQMELYAEVVTTTDAARQKDLMKQILEIAADEFYVIGVCWEADGYAVVSRKLGNVIPYPWSNTFYNPAPINPPQFFIDESVR